METPESVAAPVSVRSIVNRIKQEILAGDLTPHKASALERTLTALLGNIMDEQRAADASYADVYAAMMREHGKANRAKVFAETSPEFIRKQAVKDTHVLAQQLIISLRGMVRMATEEMRLTR